MAVPDESGRKDETCSGSGFTATIPRPGRARGCLHTAGVLATLGRDEIEVEFTRAQARDVRQMRRGLEAAAKALMSGGDHVPDGILPTAERRIILED